MDQSDGRNPFSDMAFPPPSFSLPLPLLPPPAPVSNAFFHRSGSSGTSFPILAVAVIGILATAFLLVSYYVFVIKCCLNWHRMDLLRRFSLSRRRNEQDPLMVYSPELRNRGMDESAIRAIPIFKFKKRVGEGEEKSSQECSVCLNEFKEDEKLRIIPNCLHLFHIDCIDIWLQNNANCPLCRTSVSLDATFPTDQISPMRTSPNVADPDPEPVFGGDNDFVVIELGTSDTSSSPRNKTLLAAQETRNAGDVVTGNTPRLVSPSLRKIDSGAFQSKKGRKYQKVTSMGDECIDMRGKNKDPFGVHPIRRSISMDSSADRQLYLAVQEAISRQAPPVVGDGGCTEGCSSSGGNVSSRVKRSFFSFGSSRGSRSSILPVYLEP